MAVKTQPDDKSTALTRAIGNITGWLGSFPAILLSFVLVGLWAAGGLFVSGRFGNDTYQLVINTGTTIVTFWMVFIIQNTQNRDGRAMQAKLDAQSKVLHAIARHLEVDDDTELLTRLVGVEDAPERVIKEDQDKVRSAAAQTGREPYRSGSAKGSASGSPTERGSTSTAASSSVNAE
jgi:low affinity Fe/Cu permease